MASPSVFDAATTATSFGSTKVLTMPSVLGGMALLAWVIGENPVSADTMTGWEQFVAANNGTNEHIAVYRRLADGADAGTVGGGGLANRCAIVASITNWEGIITNIVSATPVAGLNPPNLDMIANLEHLWIAYARNDTNAISTAPTTPGAYTHVTGSPLTGASNVRLAVASRQAAAQTQDPGAFTGTNAGGVAGTIGIKPLRPPKFTPPPARMIRASCY